jgi:alpha-L-rhamnosidase
MRDAAAVLNRQETSRRFAGWASRIGEAIMDRYYAHDEGAFGSQTANVMALQFGVVPDAEKSRVVDALIHDIRRRDVHLNTGIMGVRYLFEVLSRFGHGDTALALMHQDSYPSFGDLIRRGATTLWEYWGEERHDQVLGPRSLNHPMMGGFDNWFYNTLAGIRPDPIRPGFQHFFLVPHPTPGLSCVRAHYDCPYGRIVSSWRFGEGTFEWNVGVPEGTQATIILPFSDRTQRLEPGTYEIAVKQGHGNPVPDEPGLAGP